MFAVVEFLGCDEEDTSNELAVVPFSWIHKSGRKCHWPERLRKANFYEIVRNNTPPKSSWPSYKVFKIHSKFEDYDLAEKMLEDLIKDNKLDSENTDSSIKSFTRRVVPLETRNEEGIHSNVSLATTLTLTPTNSEISNLAPSTFSSKFEDEIIKKVTAIETFVVQQNTILNELSRYMRKTKENLLDVPEGIPSFPIQDLNEFKSFDANLSSNESFSNYMVVRMAAVGGAEVDATTRAIMRFLIDDSVAKFYNWKGRDKLAFEKTNIVSLIYDAIKRNYASQDGTNYIVQKTIKDWLKYANARLASKAKRQ